MRSKADSICFLVTVSAPPTSPATSSPVANNDEDSHRSTNVGAIAGGTIGGVAGIALLVLAIIYIMHRQKKKKKKTDGDDGGLEVQNAPSQGNIIVAPQSLELEHSKKHISPELHPVELAS